MHEREYNRLKHQIEAEYRKKLEALELVWQMTQSNQRETTSDSRENTARAGTLMGAIRAVLPLTRGEFDINNIIALIEEYHPEIKKPINPTSVSGSLRKLEQSGSIELVTLGAGKRPNIYRLSDKARKSTATVIDEAEIPF